MTTPLYQEIVESIRQGIFQGDLQPGDELPPVRDMSAQWNCAPGTVQRAYRELARLGLVISRPGQGTHIAAGAADDQHDPLRRATLTHDVESFLLRCLSSGYAVPEIEQAFHLALDRWRVIAQSDDSGSESVIRFAGSHDPLIARIAQQFSALVPDQTMQIAFAGSLGGLIALAEHTADIAGCHLWDEETDTYNVGFVRRLLPRQRTALLTLAQRRLGLMTAPGNPLDISELTDLPNGRFINRQTGAGTRVWLDAQLHRAGINPDQIAGYTEQVMTHTEVARAVMEGYADVGLGIEGAARAYGLDFHCLTLERYELVIPESVWESDAVQQLAAWLASDAAHVLFADMVGYDSAETGRVRWSDAEAS